MDKNYKYLLISLILSMFFLSVKAQKNEYILAKIQYQNKNYQQSGFEIQKYLSAHPSDKAALYLSAKINLQLNNYQSVAGYLQKLSVKQFPDINLLMARAYAGTKNTQKSIEYLSKYLKQKNKISADEIVSFPEFGNIADSQSWQNLWEQNNYSRKEKALIEAKRLFKEGNFQQAETQLNNYIIKYDAQPEVLYMKAQIAASQNNYKDALDYLEKALAADDNIRYLKAKADIEYHLKKYTKAINNYNAALKKDSLDLEIYFNRSLVYSSINEPDKAISDIQKYLQYYPDDEIALRRYAQIAYAANDYLTAIRTYGKLIEKYPEKTEYFKLRANAYMQTHTYNYAVKDYSMALDLYPRDAEIYYQKGMAHFHLRQMNQACAAWKRAKKYGNQKSDKLLYRYCKGK